MTSPTSGTFGPTGGLAQPQADLNILVTNASIMEDAYEGTWDLKIEKMETLTTPGIICGLVGGLATIGLIMTHRSIFAPMVAAAAVATYAVNTQRSIWDAERDEARSAMFAWQKQRVEARSFRHRLDAFSEEDQVEQTADFIDKAIKLRETFTAPESYILQHIEWLNKPL
jgi:hypothetical protein